MRSSRTVFHAGHCVTLACLLSPVSTALHAHCSIARGSRCLTALLPFYVTVPASRRRLSHTPGVLGLHVALFSCPTLKLPTVQLPRCQLPLCRTASLSSCPGPLTSCPTDQLPYWPATPLSSSPIAQLLHCPVARLSSWLTAHLPCTIVQLPHFPAIALLSCPVLLFSFLLNQRIWNTKKPRQRGIFVKNGPSL